MFLSSTDFVSMACGRLGFALQGIQHGQIDTTKHDNIKELTSAPVSTCSVQSWQVSALALDEMPRSNYHLWKTISMRSLQRIPENDDDLPPASSKESCWAYRAVPFSCTVLTRN